MQNFPVMSMKPGNAVTAKQFQYGQWVSYTGTVVSWNNTPGWGFAVHINTTTHGLQWFYASNTTFWH